MITASWGDNGRGGDGASSDGAASRAPPPPSLVRLRRDEVAYRRTDKLGEGTFGAVYRGTLRGELPVAVKVVRQRGDPDPAFWREAEASFTIRHDHLVTCHGVCADGDGSPALVLELCDLGSLQRWVETARPPTTQRLAVLGQAARALAWLHASGIAHLDVKPENVLVRSAPGGGGTPIAKVSDLGLARALGTGSLAQSGSGGSLRGTPLYADPYPTGVMQQVRSSGGEEARTHPPARYSDLSDVYSMALTAWHVLTGRPPYEELLSMARPGGPMAVFTFLLQVVTSPRPDLAALPPDVPAGVRDAITRGWALDPKERPTMSEFAAAFERAGCETPVGYPPDPPPLPSERDPRGRGGGEGVTTDEGAVVVGDAILSPAHARARLAEVAARPVPAELLEEERRSREALAAAAAASAARGLSDAAIDRARAEHKLRRLGLI